ncbi:hypothetical protein GCM10027271_34990 [Saccharopolyspora gloriosae]|uniref:Uncharacterized protein n=1 Tax=Saccharopolyspora gloriosae TaxID=455344 RepID=A0A840NJZ9_9PSEU|nr:hypothetical protein [Saccharopolyspora gloriosae]MBB5069609.1 hypothetical protein [Saccharopolyspora gloriosae]
MHARHRTTGPSERTDRTAKAPAADAGPTVQQMLAWHGRVGNAAVASWVEQRRRGDLPSAGSSRSPEDRCVQRYVKVNTNVHSDDPARRLGNLPLKTAADLMAEVRTAVQESGDSTLQEEFAKNEAAIADQADKWVKDSAIGGGADENHKFGRKNQWRTYRDYEEAGRALVGWVLQKPGRREEKRYARAIVTDPQVSADVDSVLRRVEGWIASAAKDEERPRDLDKILDQLTTGLGEGQGGEKQHFGPYQRHFDAKEPRHHTRFRGDFRSVLRNPERFSVRDKMVCLHDIYEYFRETPEGRGEPDTEGRGLLAEPTGDRIASTTSMHSDGTPASRGEDKGTFAGTVRAEKAPSTLMAREHRIPVVAGQSYTTARLLSLSELAGATKQERNSVALGIFAFWRIDYDHTVRLAAHTLHEVLDIAMNFGVDYNLKAPQRGSLRYPAILAQRVRYTTAKLAAQVDPLENAIAAMKNDRASRFARSLGGSGRTAAQLRDILMSFRAELAKCEKTEHAAAAPAYATALGSALELYTTLCSEVKAKRITDTVTRDDREAVEARRTA